VFKLRICVLFSESTVMSWATLARLKIRPDNITGLFPRRYTSRNSQRDPELVETDDCAIPLRPTWSVDDLLSSYPRPTILSPALHRLHTLSALIPPEEGTPEHAKLTRELEDLVKLVESVRFSNVSDGLEPASTIVDARVCAEDVGIDLQQTPPGDRDREALDPAEFLSRASRTENGLYVIHSDRATKKSVLVCAESCFQLTMLRCRKSP
jgi:Asp-tRNA(Asn)/Glu-tRNA(Gln) amidotransferase C subunit